MGWYCLMNGVESLRPELYHDIIYYNISKYAVGQPYNPFPRILPMDLNSDTFKGWTHGYHGKFFVEEPPEAKWWPKTKASDFLMNPQDIREIEPWLGRSITTSKFIAILICTVSK